jgi:1-acyl-sn-glycerol-3-phosphate acyltransferase
MSRLLIGLYNYFESRRAILYLITIAVFCCLIFGASQIKLEEDIARMLPQHSNTKNLNAILASSSLSDKIVIKIKSGQGSTEDLEPFADKIASQLTADYQPYIKSVKTKVDETQFLKVYDIIIRNLPLYLEESDYTRIDTLIREDSIRTALESAYKNLLSPSGFATRRILQDDPLGIASIVLKKLERLQAGNTFELHNGYFTGDDGHSIFLFVSPRNPTNETAKNTKLIEGISKVTRDIENQHKGVQVFFYGGTAVAVSNATQMKKDTIITLTITLIGIIALVLFFFRRKRLPLVMISPVIFGVLFALAVIALLKGSVSSIAVAAGSIVMGIAVNYSIHFLSHYKHTQDIRVTIKELFEPATIGSFTTIASFLSLTLLESKILNDFGLFAAFSLLGAAIFSLTFLPHFIPAPANKATNESKLEKWLGDLYLPSEKWRNRLAIAILVLTVFMIPNVSRVSFESDMNHLSFLNPELKEAEKEIGWLQNDSTKTVFITSTATSFEQALEYNEQFLQKLKSSEVLPLVTAVGGPGVLLPSGKLQDKRIAVWNTYWENKREPVLQTLGREADKKGFQSSAFDPFSSILHKSYTRISIPDKQYLVNNLLNDYCIKAQGMEGVINAVTVEKKSRKQLYAQLAGMPFITVLDKQVITNYFIENIYHDFSSILLYTSLIVFFALFISYGRIELTVISFLPMIITWIWILSFMYFFHIEFNIINIIISTFIFGIGDDFSIFTTDGLLQKFRYNKSVINSHRTSIFLCAATTILGLGALIFARHPALHSIALISIIGICCVVFIGQTVQPFLFNMLIQKRKDKGLAPWTIPTLFLAVFAFSYFVLGALVLTILGFLLLYILPFPSRPGRKLVFHVLLSKFTGSLVYIMMNVRKVHIGKASADFSKPAVIIANHASFLDILVVVMQHPRLILLTNKWVYHSPVFGKVVQMADYYPVMEGIEPSIDRFESIVQQGYSIVIFPEGTRSSEGKLKRFHKGAFYLAEKLNMDIIPLLLHGTGDTMGKGDFMLFNGTMTMKFMPRIAANDKTYGTNYAENTRLISAYFKHSFSGLKKELETARYFRQRLISNYNYKGPLLEWKVRTISRQYAVFDTINEWLPDKGSILEIGCGYGFFAYMMHFLGNERDWKAMDNDEEKIGLAANCFSKNNRMNFVHADALNIESGFCDAILLHDIFKDKPAGIEVAALNKFLNTLLPQGVLIYRMHTTDYTEKQLLLQQLPAGFELADKKIIGKAALVKIIHKP